MKVYDCFTFNDENSILEIRLNELNKYVDYFVIVEFGENHQGNKKGEKIDKVLLEKFKDKVRYIYVDSFKNNLSSWQRENDQRNLIKEGLYDANENDIIIISDLDEIPDLRNFNIKTVNNNIIAFSQFRSMYKLNLLVKEKWIGTKLCKFKRLKSPQWLRSLKVKKKYSFFRIDKLLSPTYVINFKIVEKGGWHFSWLRETSSIIKKLEAYAHTEFNTNYYKNKSFIDECINEKKDFLNTGEILKIVNLRELPEYIQRNSDKFKKWLA